MLRLGASPVYNIGTERHCGKVDYRLSKAQYFACSEQIHQMSAAEGWPDSLLQGLQGSSSVQKRGGAFMELAGHP